MYSFFDHQLVVEKVLGVLDLRARGSAKTDSVLSQFLSTYGAVDGFGTDLCPYLVCFGVVGGSSIFLTLLFFPPHLPLNLFLSLYT